MKKFMIMLLAAGMLVFSAVAVNAATKTPVATAQQQTCSCCKEGCTCGDCDKCKATKCDCCKEGCTCGDCDKCKATCDDNKCTSEQKCTKKGCKAKKSK